MVSHTSKLVILGGKLTSVKKIIAGGQTTVTVSFARFQHLKTRFHCHSVFVVHTNTPGRIYMMLSLGILVIFK
jgi:hypothetical protein